MNRLIAVLAAGALMLSACNQEDDMDVRERAEARAVEARAHTDDLAARVGSAPQVVQDEIGECVPGREDSGLDLSYTVHVTVEPGAAARLQGEIAEELEAQGWEVRRDPVDPGRDLVSVRFAKGTFKIGAKVSESSGRAAVSGTGGCVE